MADPHVIEEKKQMEEQLKQEQKREEKKEGKKEEAKPQAASKAEEKKEVKEKEKKTKEQKPVLERVAAINLRKAYEKPKNHRARIAVSLIRQYVDRHFKAAGKLKIAEDVNSAVSKHGGMRPPKKIRVLIQKFEDGTVKAGLPKA